MTLHAPQASLSLIAGAFCCGLLRARLRIMLSYKMAIRAQDTGILHRVRPASPTGDDVRQMACLPRHSLVAFVASKAVTLKYGDTQLFQCFPFKTDTSRLADNA